MSEHTNICQNTLSLANLHTILHAHKFISEHKFISQHKAHTDIPRSTLCKIRNISLQAHVIFHCGCRNLLAPCHRSQKKKFCDPRGSQISKFCHCCGLTIERNFKFCSQCGQPVVISIDNEGSLTAAPRSISNETIATSTSATTSMASTATKKSKSTTNMSLSSFSAFQSAKEKERSSSFVQKKGRQ